jgi:metal-sulfur cluster biosynthetic enzyme
MTPTKDALLQQLRKIPEPCGLLMGRRIDICDMGLVEDISIDDGHVRVTLCLTDPGCVHFRSLQRYISDVLLELDDVRSVEVGQTTRTLWTPDRVNVRVARA